MQRETILGFDNGAKTFEIQLIDQSGQEIATKRFQPGLDFSTAF